jgi:hypothetical protein
MDEFFQLVFINNVIPEDFLGLLITHGLS